MADVMRIIGKFDTKNKDKLTSCGCVLNNQCEIRVGSMWIKKSPPDIFQIDCHVNGSYF